MSKITNFHQHSHWDHNKKYYFFDMGLTSEDHEIISSFVTKNAINCHDDASQKICDVAQKVVGQLGYKLSDIDVAIYDGSQEGETDWHTDGTCRTDSVNKLFKAEKSEKLFDEAYKLLGECYSKKSSYTCSMSLKGDKTVLSSVDIKDLTEDCQKSNKLDNEECRKQFEDKLVEIPYGYGACFSSETIHRAPDPNGDRIVILTEAKIDISEITKFLGNNKTLELGNVSDYGNAIEAGVDMFNISTTHDLTDM
jgi:hypothetical protein